MKRYQVLNTKKINIEPNNEIDIDAGNKSILIPVSVDKVFLHWKKPNGSLYASCTLHEPTLVMDKLCIINKSSTTSIINWIKL